MAKTAKIFMNGRSQAVRLPAEFRFDQAEVYIRRDPHSGDVVLSKRPGDWDQFFRLAELAREESKDFLVDRDQPVLRARKLFE